MFLLLLILATVSLSSMNEFTWDKLRRSNIYHDLALPLKTMNDKARRSLRRGCSSRWPWTFQGWTMSSEQWTWTWGLSASLSSWTGDEVALGADVIRQMWKATDPILEKLSCEGTRMTATGGPSISRSGETTIEGDIELRCDSDLIDPMTDCGPVGWLRTGITAFWKEHQVPKYQISSRRHPPP